MPAMPTVAVQVSGEVVGHTPTYIGYVLGENRPGSNVSSWLRYAEINDARFWWPSTVWPASPAPWRGENNLATFEAARVRLRRNPDAEIDWKKFRADVAGVYGKPAGTIGDSFLLSELQKMGAAPLLMLSHPRDKYPFDRADGTPNWQGRWSYWRGIYASAFYLARTYGVERFQLFNEPDHNSNLDLSQSDFLRRLQLGSDAVQAAINDVNTLDSKTLRAQISAPVTAGMAVFAARPNRKDTRDAEIGWGELVTRAQNADFPGRSADNRGLFQVYAFQNYTRNPDSISTRLPGIIDSITKANGGAALPIAVTEMNVSTAADFAKTDETLDTPRYYAAFGAIASAYSNAGLDEAYIFRHTQTSNLGGAIKKNGTHFIDNADPLKNITGSTKGAEAARLWIRGFKGGKSRFAVPAGLPTDLSALAARDEPSGAVSLMLSNLGAARTISLDLGAWKLPAGAFATIEEVSETHHGDLRQSLVLPATGQFSLPMTANSIALLTVRPTLSGAARGALPLSINGGTLRLETPVAIASAEGQTLLAIQASARQTPLRVRVYGGAGAIAGAELLGQITLGSDSAEKLVDATRYLKSTADKAPIFQLVPDDARLNTQAFTIGAAQLRVYDAPRAAVATETAQNQPTRSVIYKTTQNAKGEKVDLTLHIFEPVGHKSSDKTPAIVFFFGGGWNDGSPEIFFPHCAYLASRGMVAIAPDYRVKNRQQTTPFESVSDGKSAMRWVRANAGNLGIDPSRIAAAGSSAGGHVAASAAMLPGLDEKSENAAISSLPDALVLYNPVIDTSAQGYGNARLGARWQEISPQHHVRPGLPPTIVFHGTNDKVVPYANAVAFEKAMKAAGNRCELVTIPGEGHGFAYRIDKKSANAALRESDRFLASLGYLQGEPTLAAPTR